MADVLAVAEIKDGAVRGVSREVVSTARGVADGLGCSVDVAAVGIAGSGEAASSLGLYGADRVMAFESEALGGGRVDAQAAVLADHIGDGSYAAVFFAATAAGKELAPRVAAKLQSPLLTDATAVDVVDGQILVTRPVFAGKALARMKAVGRTIVSLRPNVFGISEAPRDPVVKVDSPAVEDGARYRVVGFEASEGAAIDVAEAAIVVSGGRGMKGPENWHILSDLRDALGDTAALGASRAVVDAGWRPHGEQVGQTGKTVAPKLYFALGISGAIQHLAGMRTSGVIVAVNRDPDAPIFGVADYGIVGDVFEVIPRLAEEIRALKSG